ncbi:DENN-domain-containing protein [Gonapodya prolifera JEL478]|uniref:DENN-domain-containing protein n=1 Tax=Gonapodya prolifera (strain JEL478) TaxID=1344416 RepID=A0A139AVP7_GONPJ|nr:DENN-domain-containing protein [Gonapodya prolifera JEL478]|eukprot:KXS20787.1 DENN-domain-containing protein [Gonapodya prolifera JEL478]
MSGGRLVEYVFVVGIGEGNDTSAEGGTREEDGIRGRLGGEREVGGGAGGRDAEGACEQHGGGQPVDVDGGTVGRTRGTHAPRHTQHPRSTLHHSLSALSYLSAAHGDPQHHVHDRTHMHAHSLSSLPIRGGPHTASHSDDKPLHLAASSDDAPLSMINLKPLPALPPTFPALPPLPSKAYDTAPSSPVTSPSQLLPPLLPPRRPLPPQHPKDLSFEPQLYYRYPDSHCLPHSPDDSVEFPDSIPDFCFPTSLRLAYSPLGPPPPTWHSFILTDAHARRLHGVCATVWEPLRGKLRDRMSEMCERWREGRMRNTKATEHTSRAFYPFRVHGTHQAVIFPHTTTQKTPSDLEYLTTLRTQHALHLSTLSTLRSTLLHLPSSQRTSPTGARFTDLTVSLRRADLVRAIADAEERAELYGGLVDDLGPRGSVEELWCPVVVGVVSRGEWWDAMRDWTAGVAKGVLAGHVWGVGLERLIQNLVHEVPAPPPGKLEVAWAPFPGSGVDLYVSRPPLNRGSLVKNFSLYTPLLHMPPPVLLLLLESLLLERRILFVSRYPALLTSAASALFLLMYPFRWDWPCFPLLPRKLRDVLAAPVPWVAGVVKEDGEWGLSSKTKGAVKGDKKADATATGPAWIFGGNGEERIVPEETIVMDLDVPRVHIHPSHPLRAHLPPRMRRKFLDSLARHAPLICPSSVPNTTAPADLADPLAALAPSPARRLPPPHVRELLPGGKFVPLSCVSVVKRREERIRAQQAARYLEMERAEAVREHTRRGSAPVGRGGGLGGERGHKKGPSLKGGRRASAEKQADATASSPLAATERSSSAGRSTSSGLGLTQPVPAPGVSTQTPSSPQLPRPPATPPTPPSPNKRHRFSGSRLSLGRQTSMGSIGPPTSESATSPGTLPDDLRIRESTQVSGLLRDTSSELFGFGEQVDLKIQMGLEHVGESGELSAEILAATLEPEAVGVNALPVPDGSPVREDNKVRNASPSRESVGGITLAGVSTNNSPVRSSPWNLEKSNNVSSDEGKASPSSAQTAGSTFDGLRSFFTPSNAGSPDRASNEGTKGYFGKNYRTYLVRPAEEREKSYAERRGSLDYLSRAASMGFNSFEKDAEPVEYFRKQDFLGNAEGDAIAFSQFCEERVQRPASDNEVLFFDEAIKEKLNRSRMKLQKDETPFLKASSEVLFVFIDPSFTSMFFEGP